MYQEPMHNVTVLRDIPVSSNLFLVRHLRSSATSSAFRMGQMKHQSDLHLLLICSRGLINNHMLLRKGRVQDSLASA